MKHGHALGIGLLAMALVACGGSDGNGGRSGTVDDPSLGLTQDYRIEAVLTNPTVDPKYIYVDPLNLQVNDRVTFQLVYYTDSGTKRNVVPTSADTGSSQTGVTFASSAPDSTADRPSPGGDLSQSDGQFSAPSSASGETYSIRANYLGGVYQTSYRPNPQNQQIRIRGRVLAQGSNAPVYNAVVEFYSPRVPGDPNSRDFLVGSVRSAYDGTFRASVRAYNDNADDPIAPLTFTVKRSALPAGSGTSFVYLGNRYSLTETGCRPEITGDDGLPLKSGERTLIALNSDGTPLGETPFVDGTIVLATTSTDTSAGADLENSIGVGCPDDTDTTPASAAARVKAALAKSKRR